MIRPISRARGFTLVELLVVMTIIAVIMGLALPAFFMVRESARRMECTNKVKQLALAMQNYHNTNRRFPINWGSGTDPLVGSGGGTSTRGHSWLTGLLPYIEQDPLYKTIKTGETLGYTDTTRNISNQAAAQYLVKDFICPSDSGGGTVTLSTGLLPGQPVAVTNYKAVSGANWNGTSSNQHKYRKQDRVVGSTPRPATGRNAGSYDGLDNGDGVICRGFGATNGKPIPTSDFEIRDGMANTLAIGESVTQFCNWSAWYWWCGATATCGMPLNWQEPNRPPKLNAADWKSNFGFMSRHSGGGVFGICDGSARFINDGIDLRVYRDLATIDGGELAQFEE